VKRVVAKRREMGLASRQGLEGVGQGVERTQSKRRRKRLEEVRFRIALARARLERVRRVWRSLEQGHEHLRYQVARMSRKRMWAKM
jgi:hypothetical protein